MSLPDAPAVKMHRKFAALGIICSLLANVFVAVFVFRFLFLGVITNKKFSLTFASEQHTNATSFLSLSTFRVLEGVSGCQRASGYTWP